MKTMKKYIFMAVAGMLALSSCSNDDNEQTPQNASRQMTFTAGFSDDATTRATLDGSTKKVKFDDGDAISILSANNTNTSFTTTGADYGASATFSGSAVAGDPTYYALYPYVSSLVLDGDVIKNVMIWTGQNMNSGNWYMQNPPIAYATTTNSSLTFHNACALLKVTNDTGGDNALISIEVTDGQALTGTFDLNTSTGTLTPQSGECYSMANAMRVPANATVYIAVAPGTFTGFTAECGSNSKTKTGSVTFAAGKIYDLGNVSSWAAPAARALTSATTADVGKIAGADGNIYDTKAAAEAVATGNAIAMIAYVGDASDCTNGLAIALEDVSSSSLSWNNSGSNNGGKTAAEWCNAWNESTSPKKVTGGTWRLPTIIDWQYMFIGCGASGTAVEDPRNSYMKYDGLTSYLSAAGGVTLYSFYWSSTEVNVNIAMDLNFTGGSDGALFTQASKTGECRVRACLAF